MMLSRIDRVLSGKGRGGQSPLPAASEGQGGDAAGVIGERFETIQDSLDQLTDMARRFGTFENLLGQLRDPLEAEFRSRRDSHVELINLRSTNADNSHRLETLNAEVRRLSDAFANAEARADELAALNVEQGNVIQEARLEADRLRSDLSAAQAKVESLTASERAAVQRIRDLEQDQEALRSQLKQAEALKSEADTARGQAQRDHALITEENGVLRRRTDEVNAEIAALARTAAASEGLLATERARAASEQGETARAMRALENQTESSRAEIASLISRLETATARAAGLEALNVEQASRLNDVQTGSHTTERRAELLQTSLDRAAERNRAVEAELEEARQRLSGMETARLAAVDRAETLAKASASQDTAVTRMEERMAKLQVKLTSARDESDARHQSSIQTIADLRAELEGARAEAAISAAALDAARRERGGRPMSADPGASVQALVG